ncbi:MAG: Gfo/Idh/MocA family oxidoreductase [Lentisphaeria bacterium]|nr:Gfo/Idh/MocA family oxidoreductase [Candidatus Neomarinimicrobiota bacterium]MCF7842081.1 Gfo/Idh/MocA family oxidoreductase [Lentisphaeria bacterium]
MSGNGTKTNTSQSKIRVGIVGVGHIGRFHTRHLVGQTAFEFSGMFDIRPERAREISAEFGGIVHENYEQLLTASDAILICTPTKTHYSLALQALTVGKHIFIEKPVTESVQQGEELVALAKEKNLKFQVGHIERFNPALMVLNDLDLRPLFIESHRLAPFNPRGAQMAVVHENMIHDIDIILSLVKSPVTDIAANGVAVVTGQPDIANARLTFANGCVANVTASRISLGQMRKMRIFQPETYITIDFQQHQTEIYQLKNARDIPSTAMSIDIAGTDRKIVYNKPELPDSDAMQAEQISFVEAIEKNVTPLVRGEDGLEALRIAEKIYALIT